MATIKCVVWDLDHTLWSGVLLEGDQVELHPRAREVLAELDRRGILHSIASRNEARDAMAKLKALGIDEYFLAPQINWERKSSQIRAISRELGLATDSFAFIDDDPYERAEVASAVPDISCYTPDAIDVLDELAEFSPARTSPDSAQRRQLYHAEQLRRAEQARLGVSSASFTSSLDMVLEVRLAKPADIDRLSELTLRTHQLNTTGITFSQEELLELINESGHLVVVASLRDRFGTYGTIGLAVIRIDNGMWRLRLLLTSCRVISRGAGSLLLREIMARASRAGVGLEAEMIPTARNRMMLVSLRFAGFRSTGHASTSNGPLILRADTRAAPPLPPYVTILSDDLPQARTTAG